MNDFIYALGKGIWRIGMDKYYNKLRSHFTPMKIKDVGFCPSCKSENIEMKDYHNSWCKLKHCPDCGQVLDWSN
jgi:hypothetical protein